MERETKLWVGIDLGSRNHQVCVLNERKEVVLERICEHTGSAVLEVINQLVALANGLAANVHVALETRQSAVVEMLLERGIAVYTINPKQLDRFRDRHSMAGAKDDRRDAFVLADSLCTDQPLFRCVTLGATELVELKALGRMRDELQVEANVLSNRIEAELMRCFPEFRALGPIQTEPWLLDLLQVAPNPTQARQVRLSDIRSILKSHRIRKHSPELVHGLLQAPTVSVAPGVAESSARHILLLIPRLRLVREQGRDCRQDMKRLLAKLSEPEPNSQRQRDAAIVQSLPGAGTIVSATLLAEATQALAERDYAQLRSLSGIAPVTKRSGKSTFVSMRRACCSQLRVGVFHWARCSIQRDERSKQHYARLRARGHSHGRALRGVADRLLALLVTLLRRGELFDEAKRTPLVA